MAEFSRARSVRLDAPGPGNVDIGVRVALALAELGFALGMENR
jgi:hypothetical protein